MKTKDGEWWDHSWNVAPGCTKVSPECDNCWALAMAKRLQGMNKTGYEGLVDGKKWSGKVNLIESKLEVPVDMKKPCVIAVNLMGDLFHPEVPVDFISRVFKTMFVADWHTYMVLTKRPERAVEVIRNWKKGGWPSSSLTHIWIGTTAGTQRSANERWSAMSLLAQMGWNTWVSSEPRLEMINWHGWEFLKRMVTGGESGPYARPMSPLWVRDDRDWCLTHGVAFWFKQWGEWAPVIPGMKAWELPQDYSITTLGGEKMMRFGRKLAGRVLDGRTWEEAR